MFNRSVECFCPGGGEFIEEPFVSGKVHGHEWTVRGNDATSYIRAAYSESGGELNESFWRTINLLWGEHFAHLVARKITDWESYGEKGLSVEFGNEIWFVEGERAKLLKDEVIEAVNRGGGAKWSKDQMNMYDKIMRHKLAKEYVFGGE